MIRQGVTTLVGLSKEVTFQLTPKGKDKGSQAELCGNGPSRQSASVNAGAQGREELHVSKDQET